MGSKRAWRRLARNKLAILGGVMLLAIVIIAIFAPWIATHDYKAQSLRERLHPPAWVQADGQNAPTYILGTDHLGRDMFSRIVMGARVSLLVGLVGVTVSATIGLVLGVLAGYFGGWVDTIIMRFADLQLSFPFILLAVSLLAALGPGLNSILIVMAIGGWVVFARVVRSAVLTVKELDYVAAARTIGKSHFQILRRDIVPNIGSSLIVMVSVEMARMITAEATLSFLGLGIQPPFPAWGLMLFEGKEYLARAWWVATFPGLAIMLTVLSVNIVGYALRDVLDPALKD